MDKELKEKMDKVLDKLLDNLLNINLDKIKDIDTKCKEALNTPCKIHIDNDDKGTRLAVEGGRLSLLITLAGAEKGILKQLNCSTEEFEFIKNMIGTEEVNNNE